MTSSSTTAAHVWRAHRARSVRMAALMSETALEEKSAPHGQFGTPRTGAATYIGPYPPAIYRYASPASDIVTDYRPAR